MNQKERLDFLVNYLCEESIQYKNLQVEESEKRAVLRSLMNIRMPKPIKTEFLEVQDAFLHEEMKEEKITSWQEIPSIVSKIKSKETYEKITIWRGDITRLKIGAIINAANAQMLGCFVPGHACIDNAIHSAAGIQLREECNQYMNAKRMEDQFYEEPTGSAVVTKGYNLPCDYVIHTVGPIVRGQGTKKLEEDLENCYRSCLREARRYEIRTLAFCCISTGEFHFPNEKAAEIACRVVKEEIQKNPDRFDRIVFNVFKEIDLKIYQKILS